MALSAWIRHQPPWVTVLLALVAAFVGLSALSMLLGIVFAGIALGLEVGSLTLGLVAALLGLAVVVVPIAAAVKLFSSDGDANSGDDDVTDETPDPVEALRAQYVAGDLDDETFERRLNALLADTDRHENRNTSLESTGEGRSLLEDRE